MIRIILVVMIVVIISVLMRVVLTFTTKIMNKPNPHWIVTPAPVDKHYIPDAQEITEMQAIEDMQNSCMHKTIDPEDGCLDCGYYAK